MKQKVFVGLSGGVDSAVSAALLKSQGYDVTGVFIKIWQPEFIECPWQKERLDAMRVAVALNIPFREIDLSKDYKKMVVEDMISNYARGITPNPDVLCNRHIKFGSFLEYALKEGADYVATGHYARVEKRGNTFSLLRGKDTSKDQSYFLHTLNQKDLARVLFPVGELEKKDVRAHARRFGLPVAEKADSQGLCFVGDVTMRDFLSRFISLKKGVVLDQGGRVVGEHDGVALYTIGQRHGFSVTDKKMGAGPHYVTHLDPAENTIRISENIADAHRREVTVRNMNWIEDEPVFPLRTHVQARYRETPYTATISKENHGYSAQFQEGHIVSPGQSLLLYTGERCLGGGAIVEGVK